MKLTTVLALSLLMTASGFAQSTSSELRELKDAVAAQQQQIQQLQQQVQSRDTAIQQLQQQVGQAQATATDAEKAAAAAALAQAPKSAEEIAGIQHEVTDLKAVSANTVEGLQDTQKRVSDLESPLAIHFKGITLTPGGFLAAETVWRSHATLGEATALNSIPFSAAGQARTSEFYGSGRQSRISLLAQGKWGTTNLAGYIEADFLGVGVTSNNNQSNSYVLRQRQLWAQAAFHNGWTVTGGQMWSLVMETKKGLDNRTEATPMQIDPNYTAGMSWDRAFALRVTKNFNNKWWLGMSIENAQAVLTVGGQAGATCTSGGSGGVCGNFLIGGPGTGGGLYNQFANYTTNVAPDIVLKAAFEPGFGGHYEIFGVGSYFRQRIYPNANLPVPSAAGAFNNTILGGGFGANARWLLYQKHFEVGLHYLGGNGIGRYGDANLPEVTVYGNGYEHLIRGYQVLASLEYHAPKWDWYFYGGGEYAGRQANVYTNGKGVGYGSPLFSNTGCGTETLPGTGGYLPGGLASCSGQTRVLLEGTAGFWYKPYNGPKGRLQLGLQYSYLTRNAWSGVGGEPEAINNMVFTSFRYYLP